MIASAIQESDFPGLAVYHLPLDGREAETPAPTADEERAWNQSLLCENAIWFCRLRWIVVAVLGATGLIGLFPEGARAFGLVSAPGLPLALAAILAGLNLGFVKLAKRARRTGCGSSVRPLLWAQIVCDLLILTVVIHWLGSALPSAPFMYLFHLILACIVFPPLESFLVGGLAAGFYLGCLVLESLGVLAETSILALPALSEPDKLMAGSRFFTVGSMLAIWVVIWYLVSRLAGALRRREQELALTNARLEASSEERARHMLQTTHQLKAPFAAIHAQTQLLLGEYCGALPSSARTVVEKIAFRCQALSRQIQEMLQLANLRSQGQTSPQERDLALDEVIEAAVARVEPTARQRGIRLDTDIEPARVHTVEDHLTMLFDNLLVNAVNYSLDGGVVDVTCQKEVDREATVVVRDRGIGIPKEKLPKIFNDYYRTEEAVAHNRASTGLGLAIVRQVAVAARMKMRVESAPNWGTRFSVTVPCVPADSEETQPIPETP